MSDDDDIIVEVIEPTMKEAGDPRKEATWQIMPVDTSGGECSQCGRLHEPDQPHDRQSLHYQYVFYAEYGRWPTWLDAMAHCSTAVQAAWCRQLLEIGVAVGDEQTPGTETPSDD